MNIYNKKYTVIKSVVSSTKIPIIACGGVGEYSDFIKGIEEGNADAVAAGNIFHYSEHSTKDAKEYLIKNGIKMRPSEFYQVESRRKIKYEK